MGNGKVHMFRVLIVAPHAGLRAGCRSVIEMVPAFEICGEASDGGEAIEFVRRTRPDLIILTLAFQYASDLALIRQFKTSAPSVKILVLAIRGDDDEFLVARQCQAAGADLFVRNSGEAKQLVLAATTVMCDPLLRPSDTNSIEAEHLQLACGLVD